MVLVLLHFPQCCFVLRGPNMTTRMKGRRRREMIMPTRRREMIMTTREREMVMTTRRKVLDKRYAQRESVCVLTQNLRELARTCRCLA